MYPGRCSLLQVGVKAPGTPTKIIFFSLKSSVELTFLGDPSIIWKNCGNADKKAAAKITPHIEPMPPTITIASTEIDSTNPKLSGPINLTWWAYNAPANPAPAVPTTNAKSLNLGTLILW